MLSLTKVNHKEKGIGLEGNNFSLNFKSVEYPERSKHRWFAFSLGENKNDKYTGPQILFGGTRYLNFRKGIQSKKEQMTWKRKFI